MAKSRYSTLTVEKNIDNKYTYNTIIYPNIEQLSTDTYIITNQTDRLDLLANKYYGDSNLYWIISIANNLLTNSLFIPVGTQLCIPKKDRLSNIFIELKTLNERE